MILAIVFENPNLYFKELTQKIFDNTSARDLTSNSVQRDAQTGSDKEENLAFCNAKKCKAPHRGAYIAEMSMYKSNMLIFADETGKDGRDCSRFGYALKGQTS